MISRSSNTLKLLLLLGALLFTPLFFNSSIAMSAVVVNINQADTVTMIANWKGIGEKKAKAIITYRKKNGPFKNIDDLANVKGIGAVLIKNNRKFMSVKGGAKTTKKTTKKNVASKKSTTAKSTRTDTSKAKKSNAKKSTSAKSTAKKPTSKKSSTKKPCSKTSSKQIARRLNSTPCTFNSPVCPGC